MKKFFLLLIILFSLFTNVAIAEDYSLLMKKGYVAYEKKDYANAIKYFTQVPKEYHTIEMVICLANSYESYGDVKSAVMLLESLNSENSANYGAFYNLGNIYQKAQVYKTSIKAYKTCIRLNPNFSDAYYNLGISYYNTNQLSKAYYAFKDAIRLNPNNINAYYNLGVCCERMGQPKEAEKYFEKVKSAEGENFKK